MTRSATFTPRAAACIAASVLMSCTTTVNSGAQNTAGADGATPQTSGSAPTRTVQSAGDAAPALVTRRQALTSGERFLLSCAAPYLLNSGVQRTGRIEGGMRVVARHFPNRPNTAQPNVNEAGAAFDMVLHFRLQDVGAVNAGNCIIAERTDEGRTLTAPSGGSVRRDLYRQVGFPPSNGTDGSVAFEPISFDTAELPDGLLDFDQTEYKADCSPTFVYTMTSNNQRVNNRNTTDVKVEVGVEARNDTFTPCREDPASGNDRRARRIASQADSMQKMFEFIQNEDIYGTNSSFLANRIWFTADFVGSTRFNFVRYIEPRSVVIEARDGTMLFPRFDRDFDL